MAKGRRQLASLAGLLDLALEVRDARAPRLSASPASEEIARSCSVWIILSKADLANPGVTDEWIARLKSEGRSAWAFDLRRNLPSAFVKSLASVSPVSSSDKKYRETRVAVIGAPNVGKSMLLNRLVGKKSAVVGGVPGVTKGVAWFKGQGCLVADSPGILDPHSDARAHRMLSWLSSTRGEVIGSWDVLAVECLDFLQRHGLAGNIFSAWGVEVSGDARGALEKIGGRLGKLSPGGAIDLEAAGRAFIEALSAGRLGRISLEHPGSPPPWGELA
jgi:ribosome biogenesis GTPase A